MSVRTYEPGKHGSAPREGAGRARWAVLAVVLTAVFMQLLDTTIVTVAVPAVQSDLGASFADVQLVLAGYSLAFACVLITAGRLGDIYGRKRLFVIGMVGFTAASALCGAAPGAGILVGARFAQGVFSGLMFPQVLSIVQVVFPGRERQKALALYGASIGLATILGPVLGGTLIKLNIAGTDWRSIFYVNVPICLVALAGTRIVPESTAPDKPRLDVPGALLVTCGLFLLVLPLVIGRDHGWPAWSFGMLGASVVVLAWFALYEWRRTRRGPNSHPLVRMTLFKQRTFSLGLAAVIAVFCGIPAFFFVFMLTMQAGFAYSAVAAGAVTLGYAGAVAIASKRSEAAVRRLGSRVLPLGCAVLVVGMLCVVGTLHAMGDDLRGYWLIPALIVGGAGTGLFLAPVTGVVLAGVRAEDAGAASGVLATAQQVGAAIGIAVIGVVFFGLLGSNTSTSTADALPGLRHDLAAIGVPNAGQEEIVSGFRTCFDDRAHAKDPTAVPPSCKAIQARVASAPMPAAVKTQIQAAVLGRALPTARKHDFTVSVQEALGWQVLVYLVALALTFALPRYRVDPTAAGAALA